MTRELRSGRTASAKVQENEEQAHAPPAVALRRSKTNKKTAKRQPPLKTPEIPVVDALPAVQQRPRRDSSLDFPTPKGMRPPPKEVADEEVEEDQEGQQQSLWDDMDAFMRNNPRSSREGSPVTNKQPAHSQSQVRFVDDLPQSLPPRTLAERLLHSSPAPSKARRQSQKKNTPNRTPVRTPFASTPPERPPPNMKLALQMKVHKQQFMSQMYRLEGLTIEKMKADLRVWMN